MRAPLRAITLWQPWATAIMVGVKPGENRTWAPSELLGGGSMWAAMHAGGRTDPGLKKPLDRLPGETGWDALADAWPECPGPDHEWPRGILGLVRFDAAGPPEAFPDIEEDPFITGPVVWRVGLVLPLAEPLACKGFQKLWPVPSVHLDPLRQLWRDAKADGRL